MGCGCRSLPFRDNRARFIEGDFFDLSGDEIRRQTHNRVFCAKVVKLPGRMAC